MRHRTNQKIEAFLIILADAFLIYLAWEIVYHLRFSTPFLLPLVRSNETSPPWSVYQSALALIIPLWLIFLYTTTNPSSLRRASLETFVEITKAITLGCLAMLAGSFLTRHYDYSRLVLILSAVLSTLSLFAFRLLLRWLNGRTKQSFPSQQIAVVGNGRVSELLQQLFSRQPYLSAVGIQFPIDAQTLKNRIRKEGITEVIFSPHPHSTSQIIPLIEECHKEGVECKVVPDLVEMRMGELVVDRSLGIPLFHLKSSSLEGFDYAFKRFFDLFLSSMLLILLALPMLLITALIKLDSHGPVFYFQKRVGYKGKSFFVWKFRTMVRGAEEMLSELLPKNNRAGVAFKMENDPRVTRLGKFSRHWSLDELPQLFNVLRGQMSLVGPRPQLPREVETYTSTAWRRLNMLPGITGLWQIRGRAKLSQQDMIALDLFYLENWSLALDIKILIKTIPAVLSGRGAY